MVIAPPVSGEIQVSIQASQVTPEDIRMVCK